MKDGAQVTGGFVIAGCNGSKILEAAEGPFDDVARAIMFSIEWKEPIAVDLFGDDWRRATYLQEETQMIPSCPCHRSVVHFGAVEASKDVAPDVGDVSARQQEGVRAAFFVDERVDLRRAAEPRERPMAWFCARLSRAGRRTMHLDRRTVDHREQGRTGAFDERREYALPQAGLAPPIGSIEHRRIRPIFVGKCTPSTAADDAATILAFRSRRPSEDAARLPPIAYR
jgi:hypothetical protein